MGTLMELITFRKLNKHLCYKIDNNGLRFQVKGLGSAGVKLMNRINTGRGEGAWVILGYHGDRDQSRVITDCDQVFAVSTPDIISSTEFRTFWLKLHNDTISVGRDYEVKPFLVYKIKIRDLKYVSFGSYDGSTSPVHWKIELPPSLENIKMKAVSNGNLKWNSRVNNQLPAGSLIGGFEQDMLYIIRAEHSGSLTPGKYVPSQGIAYIGWGLESHPKNNFEVLCGYNCNWVPCSDGKVPLGAVVGGYSENAARETLYVGRARIDNYLVPGKVQPSFGSCLIAYKDKEIPVRHYEVLAVPQESMQYANVSLSTNNPNFEISYPSDSDDFINNSSEEE